MYFLPSLVQSPLGGIVPVSSAVTAPSDALAPPSYEAIVLDPNGPRSQTNLFVRKLASALTEEDMMKLFAPYGTVISFVLMRNIHSGESLGTAFVRFDTHDQARNAMASLDGKELYGRVISIQWAKKQHDGTLVGDARKRIHKLFVRNVPLDVTGRQLRTLFAKYGTINNVTLLSDTAADVTNEQPKRNIAFILFQEDGAAEVAVRAQHNTCPFPSCEGIPLMVKLAEDNRQRLERRQRFGEAAPPSDFFDSPMAPTLMTANINNEFRAGTIAAGTAGSFMNVANTPVMPHGNFVMDSPSTATLSTSKSVSPYLDNLSCSSGVMSPVQQAQSMTRSLHPTQLPRLTDAGGFAYATSSSSSSCTLMAPSPMQSTLSFSSMLQQPLQQQQQLPQNTTDLMTNRSPFLQNLSQIPNMAAVPAAFQTQVPSFALTQQQTAPQLAAVLGTTNTACFAPPNTATTVSPMCYSLGQGGSRQPVMYSTPVAAPVGTQPINSFVPLFFSQMPGAAAAPVQMATTAATDANSTAAEAPAMYNTITSVPVGQTLSAPQQFVQSQSPTASASASQMPGAFFGPPASMQTMLARQGMDTGVLTPVMYGSREAMAQLGTESRQLSQTVLNSFSLPSSEDKTTSIVAAKSTTRISGKESNSSAMMIGASQRSTLTPTLGAMSAANFDNNADAATVNAATRSAAAHDHHSQNSSLSSVPLTETGKTIPLHENLYAIVNALKTERKEADRATFTYGALNLDDSDSMPMSNELIKELQGAGRMAALHKMQNSSF